MLFWFVTKQAMAVIHRMWHEKMRVFFKRPPVMPRLDFVKFAHRPAPLVRFMFIEPLPSQQLSTVKIVLYVRNENIAFIMPCFWGNPFHIHAPSA
jgi:hypothetical protein